MHVKGKCACKSLSLSLSLSQVTHRQVETDALGLDRQQEQTGLREGQVAGLFHTDTHILYVYGLIAHILHSVTYNDA